MGAKVRSTSALTVQFDSTSALHFKGFMKEGFYVGPAGQIVEIHWSDGPGFNTGGLFWTTDGWYSKDLSKEIVELLAGWLYLGEIDMV